MFINNIIYDEQIGFILVLRTNHRSTAFMQNFVAIDLAFLSQRGSNIHCIHTQKLPPLETL